MTITMLMQRFYQPMTLYSSMKKWVNLSEARSVKKVSMKNSENIPWIIHQVWIGPLEPPTKWLQTWQDLNPNWEYKLWTNEEIFGRKWHNQHIIDEYLRKYYQEVQNAGDDGDDKFVSNLGREFTGEKATLFAWHVLADVLRYEILYEYGGYMPGADSVCIKCIDDKFVGDFDEYTLRTGNLYVSHLKQLKRQYAAGREMSESDMKLVDRYAYENASPILASKPGTPFMKQIIDELHKLQPQDLGEAVDTTGNVFMGKMIRKYQPQRLMLVDYTVNADRKRKGLHSIHYSGTMKNAYDKGR